MASDTDEIARYFDEFKIGSNVVKEKHLSLWLPPAIMVEIEGKLTERKYLLDVFAAQAWTTMRAAAAVQGVDIYALSTYRSIAYQATIIRNKLGRGQLIDDILKVNAPPGYSEHHSARAIDIGAPGFVDLEEDFEHSEAFRWLTKNAHEFNFSMSFPRDNIYGYAYEPWHWLFTAPSDT